MKFKSIITFLFSSIISVSFCFNETAFANQIENAKDKINTTLKRALNTDEEITDPNVIFELAIQDYKSQFDDYINITALNVVNKENINLPNFDSNYIAPKYYDVTFNYQKNLESSLTYEQNLKYIDLQKRDYNFDRYVTLNSIKYTNLKPDLKYNHTNIPVNPINPITPTNPILPPDIGIMSVDDKQKIAEVATAGIVSILANAGLMQNVITAFTAAISTLTTALSTSWIPFVGWVLAVALEVGALIAFTVIIVENRDAISFIIGDIKNWFYEQFSAFSSLINTYFDDAVAQGTESKIANRVTIGEKDYEFEEVQSNNYARQIEIAKKARRKYDVFLMQYVGNSSFQIAIGFPATIEDCIKYKTHLNGFSSYTWYQNTARSLIVNAGTGYTNSTPELHLYNESTEKGKSLPHFAFKHFHNFNSMGERVENNPQHRSHSFFGLLYYAPNNDGIGTIHPESPKY